MLQLQHTALFLAALSETDLEKDIVRIVEWMKLANGFSFGDVDHSGLAV
jgi:hypothetical protein